MKYYVFVPKMVKCQILELKNNISFGFVITDQYKNFWNWKFRSGVILIKKAGDGDSMKIKGCWDSIHVVEVQEKSSGRSAHYKLTSTCMLWLQTNKAKSGTMNLGGSLTRQIEQDATVSEASPHIANIGKTFSFYLIFKQLL